nr:MAG TPA: hypothetical protein [Caudoviricetes sp.]
MHLDKCTKKCTLSVLYSLCKQDEREIVRCMVRTRKC